MKRRAGTTLVRNELRLLLTAADLQAAGEDRFHGYDASRGSRGRPFDHVTADAV